MHGQCINLLGEATIISTQYANIWYWSMTIAQGDRDKTAFTSYHGPFRITLIMFGLGNSLGTFYRAMDALLTKGKWKFAFVHSEDTVIFSCASDEQTHHPWQTITLLYDAGATLNLKKCQFFTICIYHIGQVIHPGRLELSICAIDTMGGLEYPITKTEPRSVLGLSNVFHRFVPSFDRITAPLNKKLRKGQSQNFDRLPGNKITAQ